MTTIKSPNNEAGYACVQDMNWNLSAYMQYLKIATEVIILVFFLERVIALHRSSVGVQVDSNHSHWRRLALINSGITFLVILFEILVGQMTVYLQGYRKSRAFFVSSYTRAKCTCLMHDYVI